MEQQGRRRVEIALHGAVQAGYLGSSVHFDGDMGHAADMDNFKPMAVFYDVDLWQKNIQLLQSEFYASGLDRESHFLHAIAMKANALPSMLRKAKELGCGVECASAGEVMNAVHVGFSPRDIVFDSPCKTISEIKFSLYNGIHINMDSLQELERVKMFMDAELQGTFSRKQKGVIGLRINPLVGAGSVTAFSVSTSRSKFGVILPDEGKYREDMVKIVKDNPWINCIHVHTGSGGMSLCQLVSGVRVAVDFALAVNAAAQHKQITVLDFGGGLAVDYATWNPMSRFPEYAQELRKVVPELFDPNVFDRVITEFGASLNCKFAWMASRVEYTKDWSNGRIATIHAGSDLFLRACYCPNMNLNYSTLAFDPKGQPILSDKLIPHDIAGPLCFAGDVVVRDAQLPPLSVDDIVVICDVGGSTLSLHNSHCSRQFPAVYAYTINEETEKPEFEKIHDLESISNSIKKWR